MISEFILLLDQFYEHVVDTESNRKVKSYCEDKQKWPKAKNLFEEIRHKNLKAAKKHDELLKAQYDFEEAVLKSLYNLSNRNAPFDADAPFKAVKSAFSLAKQLDIQNDKIVVAIS